MIPPMCMFSGPPRIIERVSGTKIFARSSDDGQQTLVYGMDVAARAPVAMILPIPVPPGSEEAAVRFIDLEGYPQFFRDLDAAFPPLLELAVSRGGPLPAKSARPRLKVHDVGEFVASFVPTRDDFDRLDPRFRLADAVWDALPGYADFGFAVFQLRDLGSSWWGALLRRAKRKTIHPMAFAFPRRDPTALFFPTMHVHDGEVHEEADFDHHFYAQLQADEEPGSGWSRNTTPLAYHLDAKRVAGVIDVALPAYTLSKIGRFENADTVVTIERAR